MLSTWRQIQTCCSKGAALDETLVLFQHIANDPSFNSLSFGSKCNILSRKINTLSHLKSLQVSPFNFWYLRHTFKVSTSWSWWVDWAEDSTVSSCYMGLIASLWSINSSVLQPKRSQRFTVCSGWCSSSCCCFSFHNCRFCESNCVSELVRLQFVPLMCYHYIQVTEISIWFCGESWQSACMLAALWGRTLS